MGAVETRRAGVPKPSADPVERRLDDAQGAAALRLERVRTLARSGQATPADVLAARRELAQAWAALDLHRARRAYHADPTPERWEAARLAACAQVAADRGQPAGSAAHMPEVVTLLDAQGLDGLADLAAIVEGW